jgi:hypothetical protein
VVHDEIRVAAHHEGTRRTREKIADGLAAADKAKADLAHAEKKAVDEAAQGA